MRHNGLVAIQRRKYRTTTDSQHDYPVAPNLLEGNFQPAGRDRVYVADISYIPTDEGWLYLAIELDLYSHRVVGWSLSSRNSRQLVIDALEMAVGWRWPGLGPLHYSDRGVQYASGEFQRLLKRYGMVASMSRKGNPYDNAVAESLFRTLKVELVYRRRHSSLGYLSPADYEKQTCVA